jgi:Fe-S cluster assembly iron-binding protein IscA
MLTLTEHAQAAVKGLTEDVEQPTAGLRIASEQDQLAVSVVTKPQPTDVVVDAGDARVYIAQDTAPVLDDQTLDAARTPEGVGFTLAKTV